MRDADHAAAPDAEPKASPRRLGEYARPHGRVLVLGGALTFLGGLTSLSQPLLAK
ncbi:hypothetical protein [Nocardiopsis dassonvillei]|uniref:hypothetical protein n=1 Tax=Nocardiopsis dassonvillei TaxID=2014 RepID=UPI00019EF5B1